MATTIIAPPRTPSPSKLRIHRSQSFDSPSSRISVTPIDDSPYSKSASAIVPRALPRYDALKAAEQGIITRSKVVLHTKMSDDSILSDSSSSASSSADSSPISPSSEDSRFGLFSSGSPTLPLAPSPPAISISAPQGPPEILSSALEIYQDASSPMYDPWLVRVVLDLYDVRGFDWMMIAEPIQRIWGFQTSSAEVLGILSANGRVLGRRWWD